MRTLFLLLSCWLLAAGLSVAAPAIEFSVDNFDFGQVTSRTTLYHTLWFRSTGSDTLKILEIKTGCDCAIMPLKERHIAPGDSVAVTLRWETERAHGLIRRFPRVFTNVSPDPERLSYQAMVLNHADSARPVRILPYRFVFSDFAGRKRDSIGFTLTNLGTDNYMVLSPIAESPYYELMIPDSLRAGETETGFVRLKADKVGEEFDRTITIQFNTKGKDPHRFSVPVSHEIYAP